MKIAEHETTHGPPRGHLGESALHLLHVGTATRQRYTERRHVQDRGLPGHGVDGKLLMRHATRASVVGGQQDHRPRGGVEQRQVRREAVLPAAPEDHVHLAEGVGIRSVEPASAGGFAGLGYLLVFEGAVATTRSAAASAALQTDPGHDLVARGGILVRRVSPLTGRLVALPDLRVQIRRHAHRV